MIGRAILNSMSEWALFVVIAGGTAVVSVGALIAVRRRLSGWRDSESSQIVVGVAAMAMTFFALVIAFAVVTLDSSLQAAETSVQNEANGLSQIVRDVRVFPPADRLRVDAAVTAYVVEVRGHEFAAMHDGKSDSSPDELLDRLFEAVQELKPASRVQQGFYGTAVVALNSVGDERHNRLAASNAALPQAFWILIGLTAILSIVSTLFLRTVAFGLDVTLVAIVAIVIGAGILTTLLLEYPFSGSVAISSDPFVQGVLGHLPGARP